MKTIHNIARFKNKCKGGAHHLSDNSLTPSYWAVLPAPVRYDTVIPANAKLLYAEISSLAQATGYCFADNDYFAGLYQMTVRSIERLMAALQKRGYIRIETVHGNKNAVIQRRIYAGINPLANAPPVTTKLSKQATKLSGSYDKNVATHIIEQEIYNNTPLTPQGGRSGKRRQVREAPDWMPERFKKFWTYYPAKGRKAKQDAMRAWDALKPTDELLAVIAGALKKQMATDEWQRGVGIPYVATYLNGRRWEDAEALPEVESQPQPAASDNGGYQRWT